MSQYYQLSRDLSLGTQIMAGSRRYGGNDIWKSARENLLIWKSAVWSERGIYRDKRHCHRSYLPFTEIAKNCFQIFIIVTMVKTVTVMLNLQPRFPKKQPLYFFNILLLITYNIRFDTLVYNVCKPTHFKLPPLKRLFSLKNSGLMPYILRWPEVK